MQYRTRTDTDVALTKRINGAFSKMTFSTFVTVAGIVFVDVVSCEEGADVTVAGIDFKV